MSNERTNFLPASRLKLLRRDYFFRLGVVGLAFLTLLTAVAAILLVPTYIFVAANSKAKEMSLVGGGADTRATNVTALETKLKMLSKNITTLTVLGKTESASSIIRHVLAIPREGISIAHSTYTRGVAEKPGAFVISGTATTRDSLRAYHLALQKAAFVRTATLPVSAYAKDADIPFVITLTLTP